ncbi:MAG: ABC transporter substrate-binding protein, partial [Betaproteobacteria bacterium]
REFLIAATLLAAPLAASAQSHMNKIPRIGYLSVATAERDKDWLTALRQGMKDLGYIEGKNIAIEVRHAAGYTEQLLPLAMELVTLKIDIFVVYGAPAAVHAAQKADSKIPIVMTVGVDPVRNGLVASLARPGGNVTGLSDLHAGMVSKRLQMLKEIAPGARRVAVIMNPATPHALPQFEDLKTTAATLGITLVAMPINGPAPGEINRAYAALGTARPGALMIIPDGTLDRSTVSAFALEHRLPAIGTVKEWAEAGFLMSYGSSFADLWRRSATYVDKIIRGAKPGELPIEQPTKFELVINMKTAKLLGLKIPKSILVQADKVIE